MKLSSGYIIFNRHAHSTSRLPGISVFVIICIFLLSRTSAKTAEPSAQGAYTLATCIELGLRRSIPMINAQRDQQIAESRIRQVRARLLPSLSLESHYTRLGDTTDIPSFDGQTYNSRQDIYSASAGLEQLLYSGGSVRAALEAARQYRVYSAADVARWRAQLKRDITKTFYEVLYAEAATDVAAQSVQQLQKLRDEASLKFKHGTLSEFDLLAAKVKLANETPRLVLARKQLALIRNSFANLIYIDEDFSLDGKLAFTPFEANIEELYQNGLEHRPETIQARAQISMRAQDERATRGSFLPQLRAVANYRGDNPDSAFPATDKWKWGWNAGLTISWDILDGGLRRAELLEKTLRHKQTIASLEDLQRAIRLEINNAYLSLQHASEVVHGCQGNIALAEKALKIAEVRYQQGLATHLEYTDSNLALSTARLIHNKALLDYLQALADLHYACADSARKQTNGD